MLSEGEEKVVHAQKFQVAKTLSHEILASTFHYFEFETETPLQSKPGQYISVKVAPNKINCYSIAGRNELNRLNLLVDIKPGGPGSKFFANLKVDDKITFLGPFGIFTLRIDDGARHLLFLGTGSGFAPLKYMIEAALKEDHVTIPITLYLGVNYREDVFFESYLQKLAQEHTNFNYKIAVWKSDESWQGPIGFITDLIRQDFPSTSSVAAYLCGNKFMIVDATKLLLERGCPKERIYTEKM